MSRHPRPLRRRRIDRVEQHVSPRLHRRQFLKAAAGALVSAAGLSACSAELAADGSVDPSQWQALPTALPTATPRGVEALTPDRALEFLMQGNQRFQASLGVNPDQGSDRRAAVALGQAPLAIVLACADSRVAPELIFDQGLGDLYTLRIAGNILSDSMLASIEYAAERIAPPLLMVVGHKACGAVKAAFTTIELGAHAEGHIHSLVEALRPIIGHVMETEKDDIVDRSVRYNAEYQLESIRRRSPSVNRLHRDGLMKLVAAYYDLDSGAVEVLGAV